MSHKPKYLGFAFFTYRFVRGHKQLNFYSLMVGFPFSHTDFCHHELVCLEDDIYAN